MRDLSRREDNPSAAPDPGCAAALILRSRREAASRRITLQRIRDSRSGSLRNLRHSACQPVGRFSSAGGMGGYLPINLLKIAYPAIASVSANDVPPEKQAIQKQIFQLMISWPAGVDRHLSAEIFGRAEGAQTSSVRLSGFEYCQSNETLPAHLVHHRGARLSLK